VAVRHSADVVVDNIMVVRAHAAWNHARKLHRPCFKSRHGKEWDYVGVTQQQYDGNVRTVFDWFVADAGDERNECIQPQQPTFSLHPWTPCHDSGSNRAS
jgi:hypothetical protein